MGGADPNVVVVAMLSSISGVVTDQDVQDIESTYDTLRERFENEQVNFNSGDLATLLSKEMGGHVDYLRGYLSPSACDNNEKFIQHIVRIWLVLKYVNGLLRSNPQVSVVSNDMSMQILSFVFMSIHAIGRVMKVPKRVVIDKNIDKWQYSDAAQLHKSDVFRNLVQAFLEELYVVPDSDRVNQISSLMPKSVFTWGSTFKSPDAHGFLVSEKLFPNVTGAADVVRESVSDTSQSPYPKIKKRYLHKLHKHLLASICWYTKPKNQTVCKIAHLYHIIFVIESIKPVDVHPYEAYRVLNDLSDALSGAFPDVELNGGIVQLVTDMCERKRRKTVDMDDTKIGNLLYANISLLARDMQQSSLCHDSYKILSMLAERTQSEPLKKIQRAHANTRIHNLGTNLLTNLEAFAVNKNNRTVYIFDETSVDIPMFLSEYLWNVWRRYVNNDEDDSCYETTEIRRVSTSSYNDKGIMGPAERMKYYKELRAVIGKYESDDAVFQNLVCVNGLSVNDVARVAQSDHHHNKQYHYEQLHEFLRRYTKGDAKQNTGDPVPSTEVCKFRLFEETFVDFPIPVSVLKPVFSCIHNIIERYARFSGAIDAIDIQLIDAEINKIRLMAPLAVSSFQRLGVLFSRLPRVTLVDTIRQSGRDNWVVAQLVESIRMLENTIESVALAREVQRQIDQTTKTQLKEKLVTLKTTGVESHTEVPDGKWLEVLDSRLGEYLKSLKLYLECATPGQNNDPILSDISKQAYDSYVDLVYSIGCVDAKEVYTALSGQVVDTDTNMEADV